MIIMSQDNQRFVIIGRGTDISIISPGYTGPKDQYQIFAYNGGEDSACFLGVYSSLEAARYVLTDIYDSIGEEGKGKYKMPYRVTIDAELEREKIKKEDEQERGNTGWMYEILSVRTANSLIRAGYYSRRRLIHTPEKELLKIRNLGQHGLDELKNNCLTEESYFDHLTDDLEMEGE